MNGNVGSRARAEIIIRELSNDRVRVFDRILIKQPHVTQLSNVPEIEGRHHCISQLVCSDVTQYLQVEEVRHVAIADFDPPIRESIGRTCDLVAPSGIYCASRRCGSVSDRWNRTG